MYDENWQFCYESFFRSGMYVENDKKMLHI